MTITSPTELIELAEELYEGADDLAAFHAALEAGDLDRAADHHELTAAELRERADTLRRWSLGATVAAGVCMALLVAGGGWWIWKWNRRRGGLVWFGLV